MNITFVNLDENYQESINIVEDLELALIVEGNKTSLHKARLLKEKLKVMFPVVSRCVRVTRAAANQAALTGQTLP
jgi:hypothetical protein